MLKKRLKCLLQKQKITFNTNLCCKLTIHPQKENEKHENENKIYESIKFKIKKSQRSKQKMSSLRHTHFCLSVNESLY